MKELDKRMFKWLTLRLESTPPNPMDYKEFHEWKRAKDLDEKSLKYIENRFECIASDIDRFLEDVNRDLNNKLEKYGKVYGREVNKALGTELVPNDYVWESDSYKKYKEELKEKHNLSNLSIFELETLKEVCECELWIRSFLNNSANNTSPNIEPINEQKGE